MAKGKETFDQYLARSSKDHGFEVCVQHLVMTGCLDAAFSSQLGPEMYNKDEAMMGLCTGLLHDIGIGNPNIIYVGETVAPFMGAWIEIGCTRGIPHGWTSLPSRERGLRMPPRMVLCLPYMR